MVDVMSLGQELGTRSTAEARWRRVAWIFALITDAGFIAWGLMAAAWPDHLLGPDGTPILTAGYEGFSKSSWTELVSAFPMAAQYIKVLFRMYACLTWPSG